MSASVAIGSIGTIKCVFSFDHGSQRSTIEHIDDVRAMRDLQSVRKAIRRVTSQPKRCNFIVTSLPSSPEPKDSTRIAEGTSGVPLVRMLSLVNEIRKT
jgi:hypothetical protein